MYNSYDLTTNSLYECDCTCKEPKRIKEILNLYHYIVNSCVMAAEKSIPQTGPCRVKIWTEKDKPLRQESLFWHRLLKENGSPRNGVICEIRRNTRSKHHAAIKQIRHNEAIIRSERMVKSVVIR